MKKAAVEAIDAFLRPSSRELASCLAAPRDEPPAWIPKCLSGNMGRDHGFLLFTPDERQIVLDKEPDLEPCFRLCVGAYEHLRDIERWCLWTRGMDLDIQASPFLMDVDRRLTAWRLSQKGTTKQYAAKRLRFAQETQPDGIAWIAIPAVFSTAYSCIAASIYPPETASLNSLLCVHSGDLAVLGILLSQAHFNWLTGFGSRMQVDCRYSCQWTYNSFPWPSPAALAATRNDLEAAVQGILDARREMGKPLSAICKKMPERLQEAHKRLDEIVDGVYGLPAGREKRLSVLYKKAKQPRLGTIESFF